jgi:AcrR family transcriptional regulator
MTTRRAQSAAGDSETSANSRAGVTDRRVEAQTRRKAATRQRLSIAALSLFAQHGYDGVTVAEIAAAADVTERAFFLHFRTKADALFDLGPSDYRDFEQRILDEPATGTDYDALCRASVAFLQERGDLEFLHEQAKMLAKSAASSPVLRGKQFDENETLVRIASKALGTRNGRAHANLADQVNALVVVRLLHVSYMEWAEAGSKGDFPQLAAEKFAAARAALAV